VDRSQSAEINIKAKAETMARHVEQCPLARLNAPFGDGVVERALHALDTSLKEKRQSG